MNSAALLPTHCNRLAVLVPVGGVALAAALIVVVVLLISPFTGAGST